MEPLGSGLDTCPAPAVGRKPAFGWTQKKLPACCGGAGPVRAGVTARGGQVLGALEKGLQENLRSTVNPDVQGLRRAPGPDVSGGTAAMPLTRIHP